MVGVSPEEIEQILETIDKALLMHNQWYEDLVRILLCKLPMPPSMVAKDAHNQCYFGCWLYGDQNARLHELPAFAKIVELHKDMHDNARELSLKMEANGMVREEEYDSFMRSLSRFRDELTLFRQRVLVTLNQVSSKNSQN